MRIKSKTSSRKTNKKIPHTTKKMLTCRSNGFISDCLIFYSAVVSKAVNRWRYLGLKDSTKVRSRSPLKVLHSSWNASVLLDWCFLTEYIPSWNLQSDTIVNLPFPHLTFTENWEMPLYLGYPGHSGRATATCAMLFSSIISMSQERWRGTIPIQWLQ